MHPEPQLTTTTEPTDLRRRLQLVLALLWLIDGLLQLQSYMFTKAFSSDVMAASAAGNPGWVQDTITWAARIVGDNPIWTNAVFALIQLLLGVLIAFRPTVRLGLLASIGWSLAVWWFGEGLGGLLSGGATLLDGAPGGVLLYAVAAVVLWPVQAESRYVAARPLGVGLSRGLWVLIWGGLALLNLQSSNRTPQAVHDLIASMEAGNPNWLTWLMRHAAQASAHHGVSVAMAGAVLLALIAAGIFLPPATRRVVLIVTIVLTATVWVFAQALGGIFSGQGTDPNSAPLLALLVVAYWPRGIHKQGPRNQGTQEQGIHG